MNEKADEFSGLPCGAMVGCRTVIDEAGVQFPNESFFFTFEKDKNSSPQF